MLKMLKCYLLIVLFAQMHLAYAQSPKKAEMLTDNRKLIFTEEKILNSPQREANLCLGQNGWVLFFMSGRGGQAWSSPLLQPEYDGDIYMSRKQRTGEWGPPQVLKGISTSNGEDEPNISPDNRTLYFQTWGAQWEKTDGPYYAVDLSKNEAKGLGGGITKFFTGRQDHYLKKDPFQNAPNDYATDGMTISADGNTLIVAVGQYEGKMDLYISRKDSAQGWSYPVPLSSINTKGDERTPFLAPDGKTLYFASDSYNSRGGMDIFKTTLQEDNTCGEIYNLGAPINTKYNEVGFICNADQSTMLMIRNNDIYAIQCVKVETPLPAREFPEIQIKKE